MRSMLLGYRPNSSALGTADSLVIISFVIAWNFPALAALASFVNKRLLAFEKKKQFDRTKRGRLVQKFELRRIQGVDAI